MIDICLDSYRDKCYKWILNLLVYIDIRYIEKAENYKETSKLSKPLKKQYMIIIRNKWITILLYNTVAHFCNNKNKEHQI